MLALALTIVSAAYLAACLPILGRRKPGYSHLRNTISEIGETGARDRRFVALALFLPIGLALLLVAYVLHPDSPRRRRLRSQSPSATSVRPRSRAIPVRRCPERRNNRCTISRAVSSTSAAASR
jgi:hypothetical protein